MHIGALGSCDPTDVPGFSFETVRSYVRTIYDKLHVHSRTEATLKYLGR